jgi:hypothetical protein
MLKLGFLTDFLNKPVPGNVNTPDWRLATWLVALFAPWFVMRSGGRAHEWIASLPLWAEAMLYVLSAIAVGIGMQCVRRWLQPYAVRGAKPADFCKPVYLWAFFWATVAYTGATLLEPMLTEDYGNGLAALMVFSLLFGAITCAGQYFWLRPRKFLRAGFWRLLAVLSFAAGFMFLLAPWLNVPAFSETFFGATVVWVGGVVSSFAYGAVYYLYANSDVFQEGLGEGDRAPANFDYAPANLNSARI